MTNNTKQCDSLGPVDMDHRRKLRLNLRTPDRDAGRGTGRMPQVKEKARKATQSERMLLCRRCGNPVTSPRYKIAMNGSHRHTYANPSGIVFEIGCFHSADGCGRVGAVSDEFSWFPGYGWQIVICRSCREHLGWFFSTSGNTFFGLILDRLIDSDHNGG
jgi:hypothetical protein